MNLDDIADGACLAFTISAEDDICMWKGKLIRVWFIIVDVVMHVRLEDERNFIFLMWKLIFAFQEFNVE